MPTKKNEMKNYIGILIIVFCALFTNCTTEEQTKENNPPQKFEISIISGEDFATLNWTESIDPDGDKVTYNLYVDDKLVEANLTSLTYIIKNLTPKTDYIVKIVASDSNGNTIFATKIFTTNNINLPPTAFYIKSWDTTFSGFKFLFSESTDPEKQKIKYKTLLNGKEYSLDYSSNITYELNKLQPQTTYSLQIIAIDESGKETRSNEISIITDKLPLKNFTIQFDNYEVRFDKLTQNSNYLVSSAYLLNGKEYPLNTVDGGDQTKQVIYYNFLPKNLPVVNQNFTLQLKLVWADGSVSLSNIVDKLYFSSESIWYAVYLDGVTSFTFKGFYHKYTDYQILEAKIGDYSWTTFFDTQNYIRGNIKNEEYTFFKKMDSSVLKEVNTSYILKDKDGFHHYNKKGIDQI